MSALAASATTTYAPGWGARDMTWPPRRHRSHTQLDWVTVPAPIARALHAVVDPITFVEPAPAVVGSSVPQDPVEAVAYIARMLGISQDQVLAAAGIRDRTFFGWKSAGHRPRTSSLGRLWPLTQVVGQLAQANPGLAAWFGSDARAQAAFASGDANAFAAAELASVAARAQQRGIAPRDFDFDSESDEIEIPVARKMTASRVPPMRLTRPNRVAEPEDD